MNNDEPASPFEIDQGRLDHEWLRQARLTRRAGIREAEAELTVNRAKANLDVTEAEVRRAVRKHPEKYGVTPGSRGLTDAMVGEAVAVSREVRVAQSELDEAKYSHAVAKAETAAMSDRRRALERLVELLSIDYFAEPRARGPASREVVSNGSKNAARGPVKRGANGTS